MDERKAEWGGGKKTLFEPVESFDSAAKQEWREADDSSGTADPTIPKPSFSDIAASITSTWYEKAPRPLVWTKKDLKKIAAASQPKNQKRKKMKVDEESLLQAAPEVVDAKLHRATELYQADAELFEKKRSKNSKSKWIRTVLKSGTHADKLAAMVLIVQEDPFHGLKTLNILVGLAQKKGKGQSLMACDTLKDLFIHNLLPDRQLKFFRDQPVTHPRVTDEHLKFWYFESVIKELFLDFLRAVEDVLADTVIRIKNAALTYVSELLCARPEQERVLLNLLVHKLGDSVKKTSSKAIYLLHKVVEAHPSMVETIATEVERFIHRSGVNDRARYCALIFLNQNRFTEGDVELARRFVEIYFDVFKIYVGQRKIDSKIMSAILTGVNRAFPYGPAATTDPIYNEHLDALFKVIHTTSFNKSIQALQLVYQVLNDQLDLNDRYYTALYSRFLSPEIRKTTKLSVFLNIVFKSMRQDSNDARTAAYVKRLLQVCMIQPPRFVCAILFLLSELFKNKPQLRLLVSNGGSALDIKLKQEQAHVKKEAAPTSSDSEESSERLEDDGVVTGGLGDEYSSEDDLHLPEVISIGRETTKASHPSSGTSSAVKAEPARRTDDTTPWQSDFYDPFKRQPQFANADSTALYELCLLAHHYHPSVSVWAKALVAGESIVYTGNPLEDFTRTAFLDKFCYRKPKTKQGQRSVFAPPSSAEARWKHEPVLNSEAFLNQKHISPDEVFFFKYFNEKSDGGRGAKKEARIDDEQVTILDDAEVDKILDSALGGNSDEEYDYDFLDEFEESSETVPAEGGSSSKKRKPAWSEEMFDETIFDEIDPNDPDVFQAGGAMQRLLDKGVKTPGEKKFSEWAKSKERGGTRKGGAPGKKKKARGTRGTKVRGTAKKRKRGK